MHGNICGYELTPYDIITFVQFCHINLIRNDDICGTEQTL